jgi:hypothetical protein
MSDKFERGISDAAARMKADKDRKISEMDQQKAAREQYVGLMKEAVREWNSRIAPAVIHAVKTANAGLAESGIALTTRPDVVHTIEVNRVGSPMPDAPMIWVSAVETGPRASAAQKIASNRPRPKPVAAAHQIQIGLQADAHVFVKAHNCAVPTRASVPISQFDEDQIEAVILDYINAITPK